MVLHVYVVIYKVNAFDRMSANRIRRFKSDLCYHSYNHHLSPLLVGKNSFSASLYLEYNPFIFSRAFVTIDNCFRRTEKRKRKSKKGKKRKINNI